MMTKKGFTLLEILVVIVIVGVLGTLGVSQYGAFKENALDREVQSNLRLIAAAERIARMESNDNSYILVGVADTNQINYQLRLNLPTSNPAWSYTIATGTGGSANNFCAIAQRLNSGARKWSIVGPSTTNTDPQPQSGDCAF